MPVGASDDGSRSGAGSTADPLNSDSLPYADWLRWRNAQLAGGAGDDEVDAGAGDGPASPAPTPSTDEDHGTWPSLGGSQGAKQFDGVRVGVPRVPAQEVTATIRQAIGEGQGAIQGYLDNGYMPPPAGGWREPRQSK